MMQVTLPQPLHDALKGIVACFEEGGDVKGGQVVKMKDDIMRLIEEHGYS